MIRMDIYAAAALLLLLQACCYADSWDLFYNGSYESVKSMAAYDGKLYIGNGWSEQGESDIWAYDGTTWSLSYDGDKTSVLCMAVYGGRLYAGTGTFQGCGDVIVLNRTTTTSSAPSTTTTTSATGTTQGACIMSWNAPPCETISLAEVVAAINDWANGDMGLEEVIDLINAWTDPLSYLPAGESIN